MKTPIGTTVTVTVTIRGRAHEVLCTVVEHPRGQAWDCDVESLRGALEDAADLEEMEARYDAAE